MYTTTWDEIINNGNLDYFNEDNFDTNITLIMSPENVVGIEAAKEFYSNYITGFSDIELLSSSVVTVPSECSVATSPKYSRQTISPALASK